MKKLNTKTDPTKANLEKLIDLYDKYRQMQYDIFKQYNLCLEDPQYDSIYMSVEPLTKYRKYVEDDLNGTDKHSSTTEIIKEFKKLSELYDSTLNSFGAKPGDGSLDALN